MKEVSISELIEKPISGEWGSEAETGADGTPVIRNTNFSNDGRIDLHDVAYRVIPDHKIEKKRLLPGDIIIEKSGGSENQPVGRVVFFDIDDGKDYLFSNFTSALRPKQGVESKYIHYALLNAYLRGGSELFQNKTTGIRNLQLSRYLDKIKIPLPSLEEQKAIVAKLDRAQRLIDIDKAMLAKYDQLIQSVFLEMFGDPVTNPKGWEKKPMKEFGELKSGGTPSRKNKEFFNGEIDWYTTGELESMYLGESEEKITEQAIEQSSAKLFEKDSLLIGMYDTSAFKLGILTGPGSSNQASANIKLDDGVCNVEWLYYCLKIMRPSILHERRGIRQKNLTLGFIRNLEIIVPPLKKQLQFSKSLNKVLNEKGKISEDHSKSEALFSSLVQEVFWVNELAVRNEG